MGFWDTIGQGTQQPKATVPTAQPQGGFWDSIGAPKTPTVTTPNPFSLGLPSGSVSASTPATAKLPAFNTTPSPDLRFAPPAIPSMGVSMSTPQVTDRPVTSELLSLPDYVSGAIAQAPARVVAGAVGAPQPAIKTFSQQAMEATDQPYLPKPVAQGLGIAAGVIGDPLNLAGGGELKGLAGLTKAIVNADRVEHVIPLLKNAGFADDIIAEYAPLLAREKDAGVVERSLLRAERLQNSTKVVENAAKLPENPATKPFFDLTTPAAIAETTYRGASKAEWESIKNTGKVQEKSGTRLIDKKTGKEISYGKEEGVNTTPDKRLADLYGTGVGQDGVVIEFKPEARSKMQFSAKFDSNDLKADEYLGKGLTLDDVAKVTDKNGNVLYEAGKSKPVAKVGEAVDPAIQKQIDELQRAIDNPATSDAWRKEYAKKLNQIKADGKAFSTVPEATAPRATLPEKVPTVAHETPLPTPATDAHILPKEISVFDEAKAVGAKRIAPDRVPHQQLTPEAGIEKLVQKAKDTATKNADSWTKAAARLEPIIKKYGDVRPPLGTDDFRLFSSFKKYAPGRSTPASMARYFNERADKLAWNVEKEAQYRAKVHDEYVSLIKADISKGYRYPDEVLNHDKSFRTATDSRARYEKGVNTSFSADDSRIVFSDVDTIGAGMKRQDGKVIEPKQMQDIKEGVTDFANVLGLDMKKLAENKRWVYVHLNGKNPFLMKSTAGLYREAKDSVSISVGGKESFEKIVDGKVVRETVNTTMAHELGHALDFMVGQKMFDRSFLRARAQDFKPVTYSGRGNKYWKSDKEVTARMIEQYVSVAKGQKSYFTREGYWSEEVFNKEIKPAIEEAIAKNFPEYRKPVNLDFAKPDVPPAKPAPRTTPPDAATAHKIYYDEVVKPAIDKGDPVVIGADDMKEFFGKDYNDANHPIYSKAAYSLYEDALKESKSSQVVFTGGGPGSGKSELIVNHLKDEGYKGIVYDSNFSNYDGAKRQIEAARAAGKSVDIYGIIPNLEKSRGFTVMREAGGGRSITDKTFAHGHTGFPDTVRRLLEDGVVTKDEVHLLDTRAIDGLENARAHMKAGAHAHDPLALVNRLAYNKDEINKLYGKANYTTEGAYKGTNAVDVQHAEVRTETRVTPEASRAGQEINPEDLPTVQIGDGGVRQVTAPKAFEKLPDTPKTEIDRLIADGKVRVQYVDGRDVYQIKKGSEWRNVRDESSAIKQVTAPPRPRAGLPKPAIPEEVQRQIDQLEASIAFKEEALNSMEGKQFMKYVSKTTGELPEVTGTTHIDSLTGKRDALGRPVKVKNSEYGRRGDQIAENIFGYSDSYNLQKGHQEAQAAVDKYKKAKVDLEEDKLKLSTIKKTARTASADEQVLNAMAERGEKELIALRESAKPEPKVKIGTPLPDSISRGEVRSLERLAREALNSVDPADVAGVKPLRAIVESTATTVKDKIHLLDYLRTPERVLNKIGFANEARLLRDQYDKYLTELPKNIDKITEWTKRVSGPEANKDIFRWLDGEAITLKEQDQKVADEISTWLAEWADRLDLPKDKRITNYITHIFDKDLITKEFDEDLAKIISDKIPGSVYDPFLEKRLGKLGYRQDTWAALDAYVKRGTRKVHVDPILEQIRGRAGKTLEESPLEESQFKYIQRYINTINMRPTEFDNLVDNFIKSTPIGYRLGQRPLTYSLKVLRQVTYRAMLGLNPGSAIRNLSQGVNTYATLGEKYTAIGYASLFKRGAFEELKDAGVLNHGFIEDRVLNAHKKVLQTADKVLFSFFEGAERVNRGAAYFGAKAKAIAAGQSEEDAIKFAREIVRKTQFAFGSVDTPVGLSSDVIKSILQFQNFSVKQTEFLATMAKDKDYAAMLRYAAAGVAFVYTAGQAIGMSPTELIPFYNQLTGQSGGAFGTPPSLKVPIEIIKGAVDAPDKYGNKLTLPEKAANVGKAVLTGIVPAGTQIKKTYEGIKAVNEGGVFDKGGNLQFQQGTSLPARAQSVVFGRYASPSSQEYFDSKTAKEPDYSSIETTYDEVQKLKEADREDDAQKIVDSLSDEDYELYKKYKTKVTTQKTLEAKKAILPTYQKVQELKKAGKVPEAQAIVDGMTDEEYRAYELIKKQVERDEKATSGVKPTYENGEPQTARSIINTVLTYAQAIGTDPVTAFTNIFKGETIRRVDNGAIIIERMSLDESQAVKEAGGGNNPTMKLDHVVPLQLGGSNDEDNLKLVPTDVWASYTPVENKLGEALRGGRIKKTEAQRLIRALKDGTMTADQVISQIP